MELPRPGVLGWWLETDEQELAIEKLYELRQMVEPMAAYLAAKRAKLDDFRRIGDAFDRLAAAGRGRKASNRTSISIAASDALRAVFA